MPFVDREPVDLGTPMDTPAGFYVTPGQNDIDHGQDAPSLGQTFGAAFRQGNTVVSAASSPERGVTQEPEPNFNPWEHIKGTKYQSQWRSFADTVNRSQLEARKLQVDQEEADRKLLDAAPWYTSVPAQLVAGTLDLPTLIPGGAFVRGAKGGYSMARSAASVATAAAVSTAAQEAALHETQATRSLSESTVNIGASVVLGGLIGAGGASLLSRGEWAKSVAAIDAPRSAAEVRESAKAVHDDVLGQLKAAGVPDDEAAANAAITAARYSTRAERLGGEVLPFDLYKSEGLEVRSLGEPPADLAATLGVSPGELQARSFNQADIQAAIRAYHGSPHEFDRFDISKIGTGEGAQAYGHGLYFAENEQVARTYRDALSRPVPTTNGRVAGRADGRFDIVDDFGVQGGPWDTRAEAQAALEGHQGHMYEVKIGAGPEQFLDWDRPVTAENLAKVQQAAAKWGLLQDAEGKTGEQLIAGLKRGLGSDAAVADALREAGIPGIRYADANSRGPSVQMLSPAETVHGQWLVKQLPNGHVYYRGPDEAAARAAMEAAPKPTNNFVVFDDKLIDIVRRYQTAEAESSARGRITVHKDNSAVIDLFKLRDESTFMHEAGHLWLTQLVRDAEKTPALKADLDEVLKWLRVDDAGKLELKHHEQWARGFEEYLREGVAPSAGLRDAFQAFKAWLTKIYQAVAGLGPDHVPITDEVRGVMDRLLATDAELAGLRGYNPGGIPSSAGAMANLPASLEANTIAGRAAQLVAGSTQWLNPALRILHSPSAAVRELGTKLFENSVYLKKNLEGFASEPAVETLMKEWNGGLAKALKFTNAAWLDYRKGGGQLGQTEFREAVGHAMRNGDSDLDPFITKVAQEWRARVFDPLKEAAIAAKLLPPDVSVETAASYFSRMWDVNKLIAREGEFKAIVEKWVTDNAPKWIEGFDKRAEKLLVPLHTEIEELELAKLRRAEEMHRRLQQTDADTLEMSEGDIRNALRIVQGGAPRPNVETLTQFVAKAGGLVDIGGELANMGITNKTRPGFVRKQRKAAQQAGGWDLDDMARHAWENGFFPEWGNERPPVQAFLNALQDDFFKTRPVVRAGDEDAFQLQHLVTKLEEDLSRAGVTPTVGAKFSTSDELKGMVGRVYLALDADADRQIAALRSKLVEREATIRVDRDSRFLGDPLELARAISREVFDTLTGKVESPVRPEFLTVKARGPLKERTFNIPDNLVEDFLESDVEHVGRRYTRVMGADVELARKFGSVDLIDQLQQVRDDYNGLRARVMNDPQVTGKAREEELTALGKAENADIEDIEALRDLLRGTRREGKWEQRFDKIVRSFLHFNYLRSMGEVVIASLADAARPAMVHGLGNYMTTVGQLVTNLDAVKLSVAEAQLAGNVSERVLAHRLTTLAELQDPYASRGPIEAFLENMSNVASKWNGIRIWTDWMKSTAAVMTQNRILQNVNDYAGIAAPEKAYLAFLGIDESMAGRIAEQFKAHGAVIGQIGVAKTESWTDEVAMRTYRAAVNKDVDSIIIQQSHADVPLWGKTPAGRALLQFKSFALASHQKILLRGLQEDQARFASSVVALTAIGMAITYLKAVSGNRLEKTSKISENPGWWIAEGLDRSGIFAVPIEIANAMEKFTGVNAIKSPLKAFDQGDAGSQKNQNRNMVGSLLGPSFGTLQDIGDVGTIPRQLAKGDAITQGQKNAVERLIPFNSYAGVRQIIRYFVNPPK